MYLARQVIERFRSRITKSTDADCWEWKGYVFGNIKKNQQVECTQGGLGEVVNLSATPLSRLFVDNRKTTGGCSLVEVQT